jgi:cytochrome c biogenesis protein CcmG/thiol:disulfide interchange protein DsbE
MFKARHLKPMIALIATCCVVRFAAAASLIGSMAPTLRVTTFGGEPFDLADHRGQVVIINFWASWCVPCRQEMPELDSYYREHSTRGLAVLAISVDRTHDLRDARRAAEQFSFPAALLANAQVNRWPAPAAIPITYVIDSTGRVRDVLMPGKELLSRTWLTAHVDALLDETGAQRGTSP